MLLVGTRMSFTFERKLPVLHDFRMESRYGPVVCPRKHFPGGFSTKLMRQRCNPNASQIQAVGVPASLKGGMAIAKSRRMEPARLIEQLKVLIAELVQPAAVRSCQFCAAQSVAFIFELVLTTRIVEQGEEHNNLAVRTSPLRQAQSVFKNSGPMNNAVVAIDRELIALQDFPNDRSGYQFLRPNDHWFFGIGFSARRSSSSCF